MCWCFLVSEPSHLNFKPTIKELRFFSHKSDSRFANVILYICLSVTNIAKNSYHANQPSCHSVIVPLSHHTTWPAIQPSCHSAAIMPLSHRANQPPCHNPPPSDTQNHNYKPSCFCYLKKEDTLLSVYFIISKIWQQVLPQISFNHDFCHKDNIDSGTYHRIFERYNS